jgi:methylmalonyl-CoA/ethylmalonyl-CoA epimerase
MPSVKRIDHVAIVVDDIESALAFWRDGLGLEVTHVEDVPDMHSIVAFLSTGDSELELVKPTDADSGVARFLKKRGTSMHHICLEVDDIGRFINRLREQDIRMINNEPMLGTGGKLIAFIHPESTQGVLVELYELTGQEPEIRLARARALADRVLSQSKAVASAVLGFLRSLRRSGSDVE